VHRLEGAAMVPTSEVHYAYGGECISFGPWDATSGYRVYRLGEEVPPETFVGAEITTEPRSDRLAARVMIADDGARQVIGVIDRRSGTSCAIVGWIDSTVCVPTTLAWSVGEFADDRCTSRIGYSSALAPFGAESDACAPGAVIELADRCSRRRLFAVGEPVTLAFRPDAAGTCAPADRSGHLLWLRGPELAPDALPATGEIGLGSGRLRARYASTENGSALFASASRFIDTQTGTTCVPELLCDGSRRCLPDFAVFELFYEDAACTVPLIARDAECEAPIPTIVRIATGECAREDDVRRIGASISGTAVFSRADGTCGTADPGSDFVLHRLGDAIAGSSFAEVSARLD
jgi:hypothetical protein